MEIDNNVTMLATVASMTEEQIVFLRALSRDDRMSRHFGGDQALTIVSLALMISERDTSYFDGRNTTVEEEAIRTQMAVLTGGNAVRIGWVVVGDAVIATTGGGSTTALQWSYEMIQTTSPDATIPPITVQDTPFRIFAYLAGWACRVDDLATPYLGGWNLSSMLTTHSPMYLTLEETDASQWNGGDAGREAWKHCFIQGYCGGRIALIRI